MVETKKFRSISSKLLYGVVAVSLLLTIVVTAVQLRSDYNAEVADVHKRLDQIQGSYLDAIAHGVWNYSEEQVNINLNGILSLPDMKLVQVLVDNNVTYSQGKMPEVAVLRRDFKLSYDKDGTTNPIGDLAVFASLEGIKTKMQSRLVVIAITQLIKIFLISFFILMFIDYQVTRHLRRMKTFFETYDPNVRTEQKLVLAKKSQKTVDDLDYLTDSVNNMIGLLNDLLGNLEQKIKERTQELWSKNRDIKSILSNIQQGIFTIRDSLKIDPEYSKYLEAMLQTKDIAGQSMAELLLKESDLNENDLSMALSVLHASMGENRFAFDTNEHLLPRKLKRAERAIELDWNVITDSNESIEKVLVAARDVTEIDRLKAESEKRKVELEMIDHLLEMKIGRFVEFYDSSLRLIAKNRDILTARVPSEQALADLFIHLHTMKGNARMFNLKQIVESCHLAEAYCAQLRGKPGSEWDFEKMTVQLEDIVKGYAVYMAIVSSKFKALLELDESLLDTLKMIDAIIARADTSPDEEKVKALKKISRLRKRGGWRSLSRMLANEVMGIPAIARTLDKLPPTVLIKDNGMDFDRSIASSLQNVFVHCLRNSLDHGLEGPDERRSKGKDPAGKITIEIFDKASTVEIVMGDDGRGLNLRRLKERGLESGYLKASATDLEIAETIFMSGTSTALVVSDISGRGVGMDAVRKFVKELQGNVVIRFTDSAQNPDGFRAFTLVISLPAGYAFPGGEIVEKVA